MGDGEEGKRKAILWSDSPLEWALPLAQRRRECLEAKKNALLLLAADS